jgi:hypothetical protein
VEKVLLRRRNEVLVRWMTIRKDLRTLRKTSPCSDRKWLYNSLSSTDAFIS